MVETILQISTLLLINKLLKLEKHKRANQVLYEKICCSMFITNNIHFFFYKVVFRESNCQKKFNSDKNF